MYNFLQEITLHKTDSNENLGLALCYDNCSFAENYNNTCAFHIPASEDNEAYTEVFISDIQPNGIAYRDGRLRPGDQILQINGKNVQSKKETEALFKHESNSVVLLVSRCLYGEEDEFYVPSAADEEDEDILFKQNKIAYANCINSVEQLNEAQVTQNESATLELKTYYNSSKETELFSISKADAEDNSDKLNQTPTEKNSSSTMKKPATQKFDYETEHIYETIPEDSEGEPYYCSPYDTSTYVTSVRPCVSRLADTIQMQQQKQRVAQWLGLKQKLFNNTNSNSSIACITESRTCNNEVDFLRRNYMKFANSSEENNITTSRIYSDDHENNSSSAYGGSSNSTTPLILSNLQPGDGVRFEEDDKIPMKSPIMNSNDILLQHHFFQQEMKKHNSAYKTIQLQQNNSTMLFPHPNNLKISNFQAPNLSQYHFVSSQEVSL